MAEPVPEWAMNIIGITLLVLIVGSVILSEWMKDMIAKDGRRRHPYDADDPRSTEYLEERRRATVERIRGTLEDDDG